MYTGKMNGAVQTGYFVSPPQTMPGQIEFVNQPKRIDSHPVQAEFIPCGTGVVRGGIITLPAVGPGSVVSPYSVDVPTRSTSANAFVGILVRDEGARTNAQGQAGKQRGDMAGIIKTGFVGVKLFTDTVEGTAAFMVTDADNAAGAPVGSFVSSNLGDKAVALANAVWWATYRATQSIYGILRLL